MQASSVRASSLGLPIVQTTQEDPLTILENKITTRLGNRVKDLRLTLNADGLIIQGRTWTFHAKQLVQHMVMELSSYGILANEIEVL